MYLKINEYELSCKGQTLWQEAIEMLPSHLRPMKPLGVCVLGKTYALNEEVHEYALARILTYNDEEGRRIYERSLVFLFITAAERVQPGVHIRVEHSFGNGIFISMRDGAMSDEFIAAVEKEMRLIVSEDIPITSRIVTTNEARQYYEQTGQTDRLGILKYRTFPYFKLYRIGKGPEDYFYGKLVPSTAYMDVFGMTAYHGGVVLRLPDKNDPSDPSEFSDMPKLFRTYEEMAEWNRILECSNTADLNAMTKAGKLREFIRVNEALQEQKIMAIAEQFKASNARLLLIAGPSSSGKTTFANRLCIALRVLGMRPVKVSLDDYYLNRDDLPVEEDGSIDLERVDALDTKLISAHLKMLMTGEEILMPEFDFKTGRRKETTHPFRIEAGQPIVIEGIHGLNDRLTEGIERSEKFKVYISALAMLNLDDHNRIRTTDARLLRRLVRDRLFRGTPVEETLSMWESVRHGEDAYIFPFQEQADVMFNSSLTYELCFMKKYAFQSLEAVKPGSEHYTLARRLVKFLNYITTANVEDEIPLNSLLREFIGGSTFYRDTE